MKLELRKWVLEKKGFQLSFERREWAGWSDNGRQTVPHACSCNSKCPVADGAQCGPWYNEPLTGTRSQSLECFQLISPVQVVGKVKRCRIMLATVNLNGQLKLDALRDPQPVQVSKQRCDMVVLPCLISRSTVVHVSECLNSAVPNHNC